MIWVLSVCVSPPSSQIKQHNEETPHNKLEFQQYNKQLQTSCSESLLVTKISLHLLRRLLFYLFYIHFLCSWSLFPAATVWHLGLAWWSAGFEELQSGSTAGSRHLPLLLCSPRYAPREPKENTEVLERTQTEPRLSLTWVSTPTAPPPRV